MSTTVDQRVVEMRFDNKHFEKNVSTTMSTLDKLKQKLNLTGATKGLNDVNAAAKNVNMTGLGAAVDTVSTKFSALQVMGVTALANITNSAVNAGKRIVSALTIDPVKTGFSEYETKINSIQTIMSNTASKGTTMEDVTRVINELNTYADKTIYNFAEMTRNIGTFTAAGVGLEDSAAAIQGIANLAAASGSNSQQASTAMYQLSQALSTGVVKLMDWNSVVNAGMGGEKFQEALKATAREHGVAVDDIIKKEGSFRDSLQKNWLTADILNTTLKKFTTEGAKEYAKSMQDSGKWTKEQADALLKEAQAMEDAATKVKTFTQLWDTLKEAAQSGWGQTWELIIGDFEEAKEFLTGLSDIFGGIIDGISKSRNDLLGGALNPWGKFTKEINEAGIDTEAFNKKLIATAKDHGIAIDELIEKHGSLAKVISSGKLSTNIIVETLKKFTGAGKEATGATEDMTEKLEYFQKVVDDVWRGDYGNGEERIQALTKAGYDYATVQDLVNKTVDGHKLTIEDLSDAQMENLGYTEEQIKTIRKLAEEAEKTGTPLNELIENMQKPSGRQLLIESLYNAINGVLGVARALKDAWVDIFPPMTSNQLYSIIEGLHKFSTYLKVDEEAAEKFRRTFKGVFAIIDVIATVVAGPLKIAFNILKQILSVLDMDILDLTANIGDAAVKFRDWVDRTLDFTKVIEKIVPRVKEFAASIKDWFAGIKDADNIPKYIIEGLVNGIWNGIKSVGQAMYELGKVIIEKICAVLGIHSPSKEFFEIGKNIIQGLINGIQNGASKVWEIIKNVGSKCIEVVKQIDFGALLAAGISAGMVLAANKVGSALLGFAAPFEGLGDMFEDIGVGIKKLFTGIGSLAKGAAMNLRAKAILSFAIAIGVLAASVFVLSKLDTGSLWGAIGAIAALAAIMVALSIAIGKLGTKDSMELGKFSVALLGISGSLLIVAFALKLLADMKLEKMVGAIAGITYIGYIFVALVALSKIAGPAIDKLGGILLKMSIAMLLMVGIIKLISSIKPADMAVGLAGIMAFSYVFVALLAMTHLYAKDATKVGSTLMGMAGAMLLLTVVVKIISRMKPEDLVIGLATIMAFTWVIVGLMAATRLYSKESTKIGSTLLGIAAAMALMALTVRIIGGIKPGDLVKGLIAISAFSAIIVGLIAATELAGKDLKGVGFTLLMMSISIALLAVVATMLGFMKVQHLAKGIVVVGMLASIMALMILATKDAKDCKGNLIVMAVAIGVMAAAIAVLSLIDASKLFSATAAIGVLMGMFALIVKMGSNVTSSMGTLIVMTVAIGLLATALYILSDIPVEDTIGTAIALSVLLLALSASFVIASKMGTLTAKALLGVLALAIMAAPLLAFVGVLALMDGIKNATSNAIALSVLVSAMTALLLPLTLVGALWLPALIGVGLLLAMAIPLLAFVGVLAVMQHVQNATENVKLLVGLMTVMAGVLIAVSTVAPLAVVGVGALASLTLFMAGIGLLAVAIGAVMTKFPALQSFLDTGLPVLEQLAHGVGAIIGNLVAGFAGRIAQELPAIGTCLSKFMSDASGFIEGVKKVDGKVLVGVGILTASIVALTVAELFAGTESIFTIGSSLVDVGTELSKFMKEASGFIAGASDIKPEMLTGVRALAETILILTEANVLNGLTTWITGGSSLSKFGSQLPALGDHISDFATNLGTFDDTKVKTIDCACDAIKSIAKVADEIPNEGGWLSGIVGDNSINTFGSYLPTLGYHISQFANNLGSFDKTKVETVTCAAKAIKAIAEASDGIPNEGGWLSAIVGDNSIATFGAQLPTLGYHIGLFADNLSSFDEGKLNSVTCAAKAIKAIAEASDGIPNEGGWLSAIVGDNSITTFGAQLPMLGYHLGLFATNLGTFDDSKVKTVKCAANAIKAMSQAAEGIDGQSDWAKKIFGDNSLSAFGTELGSFGSNLKLFADNLGTFDDTKVQTVKYAVKAVDALSGLAKADLKTAKKNLSGFGEEVVGFASDIKSFCDGMPDSEVISTATTNMKKLVSMIKDIADSDYEVASSFIKSLKDLGKDGVDGFVKSLKSSDAKTQVQDAATDLAGKAVKGVESKEKPFKTACTDMVKTAATAIKDKQSSFYNAGSYLVDGFKSGISDNSYKAEAKARAMAKAAAKAAEEELDINSPSKVFRKIGTSVPEGFAMGIGKYGTMVKSSTVSMAELAVDSVKKTIASLVDMVSNNVDAQPTIRPVMDLSDVEYGASAISRMFNNRTSVGVLANVGAISSSMNGRSQNGGTNDLVSEIRKLRKDFNASERNTYQINGITYDDGSNIYDAVKSLVRAAKVERRI